MIYQIHLWGYMEEKKSETLFWKGSCTQIFMAALFTIAKESMQAKGPSTDDWWLERVAMLSA